MGFLKDLGYLRDLKVMEDNDPALDVLAVVVEHGPITVDEMVELMKFDGYELGAKEIGKGMDVAHGRGFAWFDKGQWHATSPGHKFDEWVWPYLAKRSA